MIWRLQPGALRGIFAAANRARTCLHMRIQRSALVVHPAMDMYQLVHDVPSYPRFLKWCTDAVVHEQDHEQQLASLSIRVGGLQQRFTTRNRLVPGERLSLSLVEGPFQSLAGEWTFTQLGESGSKVTLELNFDFRKGFVSSAFQRGFSRVADHLVGEFCQRAKEIYR
jgi:ribosome-associated toxin RatA of RatAB toxin-antitoxin module